MVAYCEYLKGMFYQKSEGHLLPYHLISTHVTLQADRLAVDSRVDPRHYYSATDLLWR